MADTHIERLGEFRPGDIDAICEATEQAIEQGLGFDWIRMPSRQLLEAYWRGVLLVPDRALFVARLEGVIVGTSQLVKPPPNNEAQSFAAHVTTFFLAPWARAHGLGQAMLESMEQRARSAGFGVLDLDVRATQKAAIRLYERAGFRKWATKDKYAFVGGEFVTGYFFEKDLGASSK